MNRFLAFLVAISLVCLPLYAETTAQLGGMNSDGNYYWTIDDDGTFIGATGAEISLGGEEKSSWGDIVSPMTDQDGYVQPTDAGSKLKLHDDGDLTLGGAVATDVAIIFDSDSNDYYVAVNDTENELQIGYGSAVGTTEQISIQSSGVIMIGEDTDADSGFAFQGGAQDYFFGIDYTGGVEEDLLHIGVGNSAAASPALSIGKAAGAVYVNHLDAPGNVDFDIGSADVDDVTVVTDGGTIILDGTITMSNGEIISGSATDDTVRVSSNDLDTIFEVYTPYDTTGDATLKLTADLGDAAKEQWTITSTGDGNDLVIANDSSSSGTPVTKFTLDEAGIVTTTNYINQVITDTTTNAVVDVAKLTHDGGTAAAGVGTGLVFQVDDAGGIEEQGSIDVSLSTVTNGAEQADMVVRLNQAGTMREVLRIDTNLSTQAGGTLEFTSWTTETDAVIDVLELTLDTTGNTSTDGFGLGVSFILEDETDAAEQQASIDVVLTDAGTGVEDADIIFSQNVAGSILPRVTMDADGANLILGGTNPFMTVGIGAAADARILFDGHSGGSDWYFASDDTADDFIIGVGTTVDTTPAITIDSTTQHIEFEQEVLIKDELTLSAELVLSNETITAGTGNPNKGYMGLAVADPDVTVSFVVSTADGASYDLITLADGATGDVKTFAYKTDNETSGIRVIPDSFGVRTYGGILFEDAGDGCTMVFDGSNWQLISNNGGTIATRY